MKGLKIECRFWPKIEPSHFCCGLYELGNWDILCEYLQNNVSSKTWVQMGVAAINSALFDHFQEAYKCEIDGSEKYIRLSNSPVHPSLIPGLFATTVQGQELAGRILKAWGFKETYRYVNPNSDNLVHFWMWVPNRKQMKKG